MHPSQSHLAELPTFPTFDSPVWIFFTKSPAFGSPISIFLTNFPTFQMFVGGVYSAREQDSSVGGDAGYVCLGVVHMEEEVQDKVQVEVGREEQGEGETHGKGRSEEQRSNEKKSTAHHGWHGDGMTHACRHLSLGSS